MQDDKPDPFASQISKAEERNAHLDSRSEELRRAVEEVGAKLSAKVSASIMLTRFANTRAHSSVVLQLTDAVGLTLRRDASRRTRWIIWAIVVEVALLLAIFLCVSYESVPFHSILKTLTCLLSPAAHRKQKLEESISNPITTPSIPISTHILHRPSLRPEAIACLCQLRPSFSFRLLPTTPPLRAPQPLSWDDSFTLFWNGPHSLLSAVGLAQLGTPLMWSGRCRLDQHFPRQTSNVSVQFSQGFS